VARPATTAGIDGATARVGAHRNRARIARKPERRNHGRDIGADKLKLSLSVGKSKTDSLINKSIDEIIFDLRSSLSLDDSSVTKIEVAGKNDQDAATEVIDLLKQRLHLNFDKIKAGADLRYPVKARIEALLSAR